MKTSLCATLQENNRAGITDHSGYCQYRAPAGDNNDPKKYAQDVAKWMGVSPNTVLNLANPETMAALMQSMARKEGYSNWNSPLAYQAAGGSLNQQTVINVHGVNNPQEAANLIADKQGAVNAGAVQQLKGPA